ncbi:MAG: hypothetical protein SFZ24_08265 [Planctomycetota bacterium]|nr:hypothetical protein [Planctomycetota bacterium]
MTTPPTARGPAPRTTVRGRTVLLIMLVGVLAVTAVLYTLLVRLKLNGPEALKMRPAPATGAAPSQ